MNGLLLLVPFGISVLAALFKPKLGYIALMVSAVLLAAYGAYTGLGTISFFYFITGIIFFLASWYSIKYDHGKRWLSPLFALAIFGIALILLSQNFLELVVGWEIMGLSGYALIGLNRKGSWPAFIFSAFSEFSTVFIVAGLAYAYVANGTFAFIPMQNDIPLLLMAIGFFLKMGIVPFAISDWLPVAHRSAPSNVSAILSTAMTLMGVFGILRIAMLSPASLLLGVVLMLIGGFSVFFAALFAYVSNSTKTLLGYSTIENNGAILIGLGIIIAAPTSMLAAFALATVLMFSLAHSMAKTGMFLMSGSLDSEDMASITNKEGRLPTIGGMLLVASLSGLLPTIGGVAVWMLLESLFSIANISTALGVIAVIVGALVALGEGLVSGAMLKLISFIQLFNKKGGQDPVNMRPVIASAALVVIFGVASILLINSSFISGNTAVGIPNGALIESISGSDGTFGVVSPVFVALLITAFAVIVVSILKKPRLRRSRVWNGGTAMSARYTSFAFANNIRIMMGRILNTDRNAESADQAVHNIFWETMLYCARLYKEAARRITWKIMNSAMYWYVIYIIVAFIFVTALAVTIA